MGRSGSGELISLCGADATLFKITDMHHVFNNTASNESTVSERHLHSTGTRITLGQSRVCSSRTCEKGRGSLPSQVHRSLSTGMDTQ